MKKNTQPKTGSPCHCKRGQQRDNCPDCEGTGQRIDFKAIRSAQPATDPAPVAARGSYRTKDGKAQIEWELKPGANGPEFSASGDYAGGSGQCVDAIAKAYPQDETVQRIAKVWRAYHLNGMQSGTPAQVAFLAEKWEAAAKLHPELADAPHALASKLGGDHYTLSCDWLKAAGLYEAPLPAGLMATGGFPEEVTSGERGYRYGERWVYLPIPADVLKEIKSWNAAPQPRESLAESKAKSFLADNGLKLRVTLSDTKPAPWGEAGQYRPHFRATLSRSEPKGARLAFDFWGAVDSRTADLHSVLSCVASDVHTPDTFADFCAEYGYEEDSRAAMQTFRRADSFAKRLRAFFTESEIEALGQLQ